MNCNHLKVSIYFNFSISDQRNLSRKYRQQLIFPSKSEVYKVLSLLNSAAGGIGSIENQINELISKL